MSESTAISWTDATFNPVWGCTKVSPACDHCYAERDAKRFAAGTVLWGVGSERRQFGDAHWKAPLKWAKTLPAKLGRRPRIFCASMADVFDKDWPDGVRERLFKLIEDTPEMDWLLLTKRIGNVARMIPDRWSVTLPANVWIGATVVNQEEADRDVPKLLAIKARVRFLSIEPMLGPMDIVPYIHCDIGNAIEWVIVGGESGPHARPLHIDWVRSIVQQSNAAGVAVHVKQLGKRVHDSGMSSPGQHWPRDMLRVHLSRKTETDPAFEVQLDHVKGGDLDEWPEDLRVQEFPA